MWVLKIAMRKSLKEFKLLDLVVDLIELKDLEEVGLINFLDLDHS